MNKTEQEIRTAFSMLDSYREREVELREELKKLDKEYMDCWRTCTLIDGYKIFHHPYADPHYKIRTSDFVHKEPVFETNDHMEAIDWILDKRVK